MSGAPPGWGRYPAWLVHKHESAAAPANTGPVPVVTAPGMWHKTVHEGPVPAVTPIPATHHRIDLGPVCIGAQHNPSIVSIDGTLHVSIRVLVGKATTNFLATVRKDWSLFGVARVMHNWGMDRGHVVPGGRGHIELEDFRLFTWLHRLWAIAAVHDGSATLIQQGLVELGLDGLVRSIHCQISPRHEKNWMPWIDDAKLRLVYSIDPLVALDVDPELRLARAPEPQGTGTIRGGSQLVPYSRGWLCIVHQVYRPKRVAPAYNPLLGGFPQGVKDPVAGDAPVVYLHHFVKIIGSDVLISRPFYFRQIGVEFCAGLTRHEGSFVASFGVADKEAWLAEISEESIEELFS